MQREPPTAAFTDVECNPNPAPNTTTTAEPVVGILDLLYIVSDGGCSSGPLNADMLVTIEPTEIVIPSLLEMKGYTLKKITESQSHDVEAAAERPFAFRKRGLEFHEPSPEPTNVIDEAADAADTSVRLPNSVTFGTNANEALKFATALWTTVRAILRMRPRNGD
jgi:hypothetical protein